MNIRDLVNILSEYSQSNKPFRVEIVKTKSTIKSLQIIDYPVLKKWKKLDNTFDEQLKKRLKPDPAISFLSLSKRNKLFVPYLQARHIQEFSMKYSKNEQYKFWKYLFRNSMNQTRVFTEGSEVGYMHVKVELPLSTA